MDSIQENYSPDRSPGNYVSDIKLPIANRGKWDTFLSDTGSYQWYKDYHLNHTIYGFSNKPKKNSII